MNFGEAFDEATSLEAATSFFGATSFDGATSFVTSLVATTNRGFLNVPAADTTLVLCEALR